MKLGREILSCKSCLRHLRMSLREKGNQLNLCRKTSSEKKKKLKDR